MDHERLTGRQCYFLLTLFMLGNLVTASGAKGLQAGWILFLSLAAVSIAVFWFYAKAVGNKPAGKIFVSSLGPYFGGALTLLYGGLSVLLAGDAIRLFADFIVINDLNDAGAWGNSALLTLIVLLLLCCEMRSLGKVAWGVLPLAAVLLILSVVFTASQIHTQRLLPLFAEHPDILFRGWLGSFSSLIAAALLPISTMAQYAPSKWQNYLFAAGITACLLLALLCLRNTAVLGFPAVSMFRFPAYTAANTQRHSEILISAVFVLCQPFRAVLCLRYAQACLKYWLPRFSKWYAPLLLGLSVLSGIFSWSSEQVRWRTLGEGITAALFLLGPLLVLTADKIRASRRV